MRNILYIGSKYPSSTAAHRANALSRLGYNVNIIDPVEAIPQYLDNSIFNAINFKTGYLYVQSIVLKWLSLKLDSISNINLIWVDSGELLGADCLQLLKKFNCPIILFNVDDPTGKRDGNRFKSLLKAIHLYDLVVVVRRETEKECISLGAKKVLRVFRSYDEVAHKPFDNYNEIPLSFRSEVAFIGTWMRHEKRDLFVLELIQHGIPMSIWGDRWQKSPYWKLLKNYYRGGALGGRDYVAAIQGAKICLGLLSKGNRDLHTQRSLEVPYIGGLLCAERTVEHLEMYKENSEAIFWSDVKECASLCKELLLNDALRETNRLGGMKRVRNNFVGNEDICRLVLNNI
jgi:spore maturation protein CgeB